MTERATRAWLPPILARRISTRSRRLLAASPVLFREVAAFFFANDGARAIGADAAAGAGRALRATGSSPKARPIPQHADGSTACSLSAISGWRVGVLYPLARGCRRFWRGASRPARAACWRRRRFFFAKSPRSFSPMMELGRSARTLLPAPGERCELRGLRPRPDRFRSTPIVYGVLSLRHFRLASWCSLSLGAWLPPILARRISTRSRRLLAASPVLFREVAAFFFANDGARAIGADAAAGAGRALRATGSSPKARPIPQHADGSTACSLSAISGWRVGVLYPLARGCRRFWRGASRPARAACWRHHATNIGMGTGRRAAAAKEMVGPRATSKAVAA